MELVSTPSPLQSLPAVIRALRGAVGAWVGPGLLSIALGLLLHRRLGQICGRIERLAARFEAGRLWRRRPRPEGGESHVEGDGGPGARGRATGVRIWPGRFGWLVGIAGYRAAAYGCQLRAMLEQPEMVALLEAAPQAVRILRPLCRMLAIETSVLRPGVAGSLEPARSDVVPAETKQRVRKTRPKVDWGRIALPRGVLAWAKREGYGKVPKG